MPKMSVSIWDLTDEELDQLAADRDTTEPKHAEELRRFKLWRRTEDGRAAEAAARRDEEAPAGESTGGRTSCSSRNAP
jgi:hypothetical protein